MNQGGLLLVQGSDQIAFYAQEGIWYEPLNQLARLRQSQLNNAQFTSVWQEFLTGSGVRGKL